MFFRVDPRLFQRRPFLGVRLGAVSLAFWSPVRDVVSRIPGLGNTAARVDLSQIAPPTENHGKWAGSTKPWSCIAISALRRSRSHRKAGSSAESQRLSSSRELKVPIAACCWSTTATQTTRTGRISRWKAFSKRSTRAVEAIWRAADLSSRRRPSCSSRSTKVQQAIANL